MSGKRTQTIGSPVGSPSCGNISDSSSKEQDRFLPIANVGRIMKKSLPGNAKISKEAKETVQECVSEFISFITGEASDKCQREKRKTINGDDLLWAMTTLGFENYVGPLKVYLSKYRETEEEKHSLARIQDQDPNHPDEDHSPAAKTPKINNNDPIGQNVDFQNFNGGIYSLGTQVSSNNSVGRVIGYGENLMARAFNINGVHENMGDGNGSRAPAMAAHLHHGSGW